MTAPGFVISAPSSGAGKTTLTLGLARAFRNRGMAVQCFKSGPDYIDPAFHRAATGRQSLNLDSWAMDLNLIQALMGQAGEADLTIVEGSMGLFDGVAQRGKLGSGASADIARLMRWPVILVIDPKGQAQTAGAIAMGIAAYAPDVSIAGVILNRLASGRHEALVRAGMEKAGIAVLGAIPRHAPITLPERHLGLVQAQEHQSLEDFICAAALLVEQNTDLDSIFRAARPRTEISASQPSPIRPPGQRIALAYDTAFSFVYPHIVEGWRLAGAQIIPFSPLADQEPDRDADVCWLPGGYPELYAGKLAANHKFLNSMREFARARRVHGECGGYMVMGNSIIDANNVRHGMLGLLGLETSFNKRRMTLGYRLAQSLRPFPGRDAGAGFRGHEFHYATIISQPDDPLANVYDANGNSVAETGSVRGNASGTFFHMIAEDT